MKSQSNVQCETDILNIFWLKTMNKLQITFCIILMTSSIRIQLSVTVQSALHNLIPLKYKWYWISLVTRIIMLHRLKIVLGFTARATDQKEIAQIIGLRSTDCICVSPWVIQISFSFRFVISCSLVHWKSIFVLHA